MGRDGQARIETVRKTDKNRQRQSGRQTKTDRDCHAENSASRETG